MKKIDDVVRDHTLKVLADLKGNRTKTAKALGVSLRCLKYRLARYRDDGYKVVDPEIARGPKVPRKYYKVEYVCWNCGHRGIKGDHKDEAKVSDAESV